MAARAETVGMRRACSCGPPDSSSSPTPVQTRLRGRPAPSANAALLDGVRPRAGRVHDPLTGRTAIDGTRPARRGSHRPLPFSRWPLRCLVVTRPGTRRRPRARVGPHGRAWRAPYCAAGDGGAGHGEGRLQPAMVSAGRARPLVQPAQCCGGGRARAARQPRQLGWRCSRSRRAPRGRERQL